MVTQTVGAAIAVLVPFYGDPQDLRECLQSLVAQTDGRWRAMVVDDASPRGSAQVVVQELADPRISWVSHAVNRGLAAARNTGAQGTEAPWLLPLDSDDMLPPDVLALFYAAIEQEPEIDCFFGNIELFGSESGQWHYKTLQPADLVRHQWLPGAGALLRRELWQRAGGWCEDTVFRPGNEDWDFWLGVAASGPMRVKHLNCMTYCYRRRAGSMSVTSLQLHDGETREAMLTRHHTLFSSSWSTSRFVADGWWRSTWARIRIKDYAGARRAAMQWLLWRIRPSTRRDHLLATGTTPAK